MKKFVVPIFVIICLISRDYFSILIPMEIIVIGISFLFIFLNIEEIIALIAFLIPFENSILIPFLFISAVLIIIFKKKFKLDKIYLFLIFFILIWEIIHISYGYFLTNTYIKFFAALIFFLVVYSMRSLINFAKISRYFITGLFLFIVLLFIKQIIVEGFTINDVSNNFSRLGYYDQDILGYGLYNNPNAIGISINVALGFLFVDILSNKELKIINIFLVFLFIFAGIITQSKTFLLVLVFQLLYIFIFRKGDLIKKINQIVLFSLGITIVFFTLNFLFPSLIDQIIVRFSPEYIFSARDTIFNNYMDFIFSSSNNLFIGVGIQNINLKSLMYSNPHNIFQEVFVAWGIVGLIWITLFITKIFTDALIIKTNKLNRDFFIRILPLISFLLSTQFSRVFSKPEFIILYLLSIGGIYRKSFFERKRR